MPPAVGGPRVIAMDGPVASGKSTVGRAVADRLGYLFLDTGVFYRALTVLALDAGLGVTDGPALAALVDERGIVVRPAPGTALGFRVHAGADDLTARLWTSPVDRAVSPVSAEPAVRAALLEPQRAVARQGAVVMVGRDVGTVVLPDADLKVFLVASPEYRARRRLRERLARGVAADYRTILTELRARDAFDSARAAAPLRAAASAVVVDTDACDRSGVVAHVLALVARWPDALTTGGGAAPCGSGVP
jgi:CMP/dCMP kinase